MPDLSDCVKDDEGNMWCFDDRTNEVYKILLEKSSLNKIPPKVFMDLLIAKARKLKNDRAR